MSFTGPIYSVPTGIAFGQAPVPKFVGQPTSGLLAGRTNVIFFSPGLKNPEQNEIDIEKISITAKPSDSYSFPKECEERIFQFGGGTGYTGGPKTNDTAYRTQPNDYQIRGVMIQTPSGPVTPTRIP